MTISSRMRNLPAFQQRLVSSLVMLAAYGLVVACGPTAIKATFLFLAGALCVEWVKMCRLSLRITSLLMIGLVYSSVYAASCHRSVLGMGVLLCFISLGVLLSWMAWYRRFLWVSLGLLYIGLPCVTLFWILEDPSAGVATFVALTAVVALNDTAAYLFGNWLKGPLLLPGVSPSKTWSGFLGGILCVALCAGIFYFSISTPASLQGFVGISAGLAFLSSLGDLLESKLKRLHRIKDSGGLIPGHGGLLDRLDGFLFMLPLFGLARLIWPDIISFSLR